ncbi:MAG TPA: DUF1800 family protein [Pyrinomonadaceae bacterium]|nr:DUF1800 family protein [Pyrinomonadaceae bacterium]
MESRISRSMLRVLAAFVLISTFGLWVMAQDDPDPNSPTPILLSEFNSTRALAQNVKNGVRVPLTKIPSSQAFPPDSEVVIYLSDLDLMEGEGANAFRVYATDGQGRSYRFPVLDLQQVQSIKNVWELTIQLSDAVDYWDTKPEGDLAVYVTWRGLASNTVKLGVGAVTRDDGSNTGKPTPLGTTNLGRRDGRNGKSISPDFVGYRFAGDRRRFLEQATFGPTQAMDDRIRRIGLRTWLNEQFSAPYPSAYAYPNQLLKAINAPADCDGDQTVVPDVPATCFRDTYSPYQPQTWFFKEAYYDDAQLHHRMAWILSQLWVTSDVDNSFQGRHMVEYHKVLANNAFGNFRDLMGPKVFDVPTGVAGINTCSSCGMTLNPTMGDYLSMMLSTKTSPNENYAREIMQLFTVGLFNLNLDGTVKCIENNPCQTGDTPSPTYDQNNVNNLTKVFTGWALCSSVTPATKCPSIATNPGIGSANYIDPLLLVSNNHDLNAKTLLDYPGANPADRDIPACTVSNPPCTTDAQRTAYAQSSMIHALNNIYDHPNVAPFISKYLIQQFVTSDPTPAYVSRVAAVFNANRTSPSQLKEVVRAILTDVEARGDVKTDPHFGKLREPVLFATNVLRAFGVRSANGASKSDGFIATRSQFTGMAQVPYMSPTVFNFFPPGYVIPGTTTPGPEFAILNTGTSIQRANFINFIAFTNPLVAGATTDSPDGTSLDYSDLQALSAADATGGQLVDELNRRLLHGTMSPTMRSTILTAVTAVTQSATPTAAQTLARSQQAVYLVTASTQFQVER